MTTATDPDQPRSASHDHQGHRRSVLIVVIAAMFFGSGFWTSTLLHQDRVREEGQRLFHEFLVNFDQLGLINHDKLDEIVCIVEESTWDRDALSNESNSQSVIMEDGND